MGSMTAARAVSYGVPKNLCHTRSAVRQGERAAGEGGRETAPGNAHVEIIGEGKRPLQRHVVRHAMPAYGRRGARAHTQRCVPMHTRCNTHIAQRTEHAGHALAEILVSVAWHSGVATARRPGAELRSA